MTALPPSDRMTVEDYLAFEETSQERHEYLDGHLVAMAGESKNHNRVVGNLVTKFQAHLRGKPCETFFHGIKVYVNVAEFKSLYYYPDVVVDCPEQPSPESPGGYIAQKPRLIVEVLSPNSMDKDEVEKYFAYQHIPSLQEYLIVEQDPGRRSARLHRREANWRPEAGDIVVGAGQVHLRSIDLTLDLDEVYDFS